jgi:hypothetical protein
MLNRTRQLAIVLMIGSTLAACAANDPKGSNGNNNNTPANGAACEPPVTTIEDVSACAAVATDYRPRDNGSANDTWPACISDDNLYHQIQPSVSTIARVTAFEAIGDLLWKNGKVASTQDFIDARIAYEEEQGLGSRIARRFDPHYTAPASGNCENPVVAAANPDYCVGPTKLQPLVVAAFADGALGNDPVVNAARIEAALLWFFYVSVIKEATTCTAAPQDCDSSWAYYGGGVSRSLPIGLGRYVDRIGPETHNRAYDGVLAVRCWKNLDNETGLSTNLTLRDQAIGQLDAALLRGMALIVRQRFLELECASGDFQMAALAELQVLVPLLDRATRVRDAGAADLLLAETAKAADAVDVAAAVTVLDAQYSCP